jgi:tetratricopeptide (TPR) repeat protein
MKSLVKTAIISSLVLLLAATAVMAQGQLRVKFTVLDEKTKQPIVGAKVVAYQPERPNNKWNDTSNEKGEFIVIGMSPGQAIVEITAEGYVPARLPIRLRTGRDRLEYNLEIKPVERAAGTATPEINARFQEGMKLFSENKFTEALVIFEELYAKYPDLHELYASIATTYHSLKQSDKAIEWLLKGLEAKPDDENLMLRVAETYAEMGKSSEANEWYGKIIAKNPKDNYAIEKIAAGHYGEGRFTDAITYYQMAVANDEKNALFHYYLGNSFYMLDKYEDALKHYELYVQLDPQNQFGGLNATKELIADCKKKLNK